MKKKWFYLFVFSMMLFFANQAVYAKFTMKNSKIECYYGNGVVAGFNTDEKGKSLAYIKKYDALSKTTTIPGGDELANIEYYNPDHALTRLKTFSCPSFIRLWKAWEYDNMDDKNQMFRGVYSFDWCKSKAKGCSEGDTSIKTALTETHSSGWWIFSSEEQTSGVVSLSGTNILKKDHTEPEVKIPLVGERVRITGDVGEDAYVRTYRLYNGDADNDGKEDEAQAVGQKKYAQIYATEVSGQYLFHVGADITPVTVSADILNKSEYVCVKESQFLRGDPESGDSGMQFNISRHKIEKSSQKAKCAAGYQKYIRTTEVCKIQVGNTAGSFCDKYSNTAFVIIDIIKIMQILVPALVIVLTGVEIGKIVVTGNVEEELPKRKTSIIVRCIVMIAFLFLPYITHLIISLAEGVSILDVSCLFNDGQPMNIGTSELDCKDAIEEEK